MAVRGYRGILAAVPPAQRLRSASGKRGKQIRIKSQSNGNGNGKINSFASKPAPTVGPGASGEDGSADRPPSQRCGDPTSHKKISAHPELAPIHSAFHHSTGRALARLQLLISMHRPLERPSGGSAQWATRHGCRVSRARPGMADRGGPRSRTGARACRALARHRTTGARALWLLSAGPRRLFESDPPSGRNPRWPLPQKRICTPLSNSGRSVDTYRSLSRASHAPTGSAA